MPAARNLDQPGSHASALQQACATGAATASDAASEAAGDAASRHEQLGLQLAAATGEGEQDTLQRASEAQPTRSPYAAAPGEGRGAGTGAPLPSAAQTLASLSAAVPSCERRRDGSGSAWWSYSVAVRCA